MKTLIAYTSLHGATALLATKLSDQIHGECQIINLKENSNIQCSDYDKIILGCSIYAGHTQSEMVKFCENNKEDLLHQPLGLFLSCMGATEQAILEQLSSTFGSAFMSHATVSHSFGCILDPLQLNFIERFIVKTVSQSMKKKHLLKDAFNGKDLFSTISEDAISRFAHEMNQLHLT